MMNAGSSGDGRERIERAYYALKADEWGMSFKDAKEMIEFNELVVKDGLKQLKAGKLK